MTDNYDYISDDRNIFEAEREWDSGIAFAPSSNTYGLVKALLEQADRIDSDLERIYESQHVDSATGADLEKFGELINLDRKSGESDDKYRARIKASFRASTIETTFDQFVEFCASVLNTSVSNLNFTTNYERNSATVTVGADTSVYNSVNLSNSEVKQLLGKGVPAGHAVKVVEGGTFRLKKDGTTSDASKGLTSDSISTGGTLAEDLL